MFSELERGYGYGDHGYVLRFNAEHTSNASRLHQRAFTRTWNQARKLIKLSDIAMVTLAKALQSYTGAFTASAAQRESDGGHKRGKTQRSKRPPFEPWRRVGE